MMKADSVTNDEGLGDGAAYDGSDLWPAYKRQHQLQLHSSTKGDSP